MYFLIVRIYSVTSSAFILLTNHIVTKLNPSFSWWDVIPDIISQMWNKMIINPFILCDVSDLFCLMWFKCYISEQKVLKIQKRAGKGVPLDVSKWITWVNPQGLYRWERKQGNHSCLFAFDKWWSKSAINHMEDFENLVRLFSLLIKFSFVFI